MWQEIAVFFIGIGVVGYVGLKIYRMISQPPKSCCDNCQGCPLKDKIKKR